MIFIINVKKLGSLLGLWGRGGWGGGDGLWDVGLLLLGLADLDDIGVGGLGAGLAGGVVGQHNLHLQTDDSLAEEDVADGNVDVLSHWVTGVDHQTVGELHCLGTLSTKLTRDDDLATFGAGLHDETEDTIGGTANGKTTHELVAHRLALSGGAETTVGDLLGEELDLAVLHLETLLDEGGQLSNALGLLAKNILGTGGQDDDLGTLGGDADLDTGVAILGQFAAEESVQLGLEDSLGDVLSLLGNIG